MNTITEITAALEALEAKMAEKGIPEPDASIFIRYPLKITVFLDWSYKFKVDGAAAKSIYANTPAKAFAAANEWIDALPSPQETAIREFHRKVGDAIEHGREHGIDDEYIEPLVQSRKAMTDNLLTNEASK